MNSEHNIPKFVSIAAGVLGCLDLVRGFILEKFFIETHPDHKLAQMRAYGGLAGAEYEAAAAPTFFEKYLDLES